MIELDAKRLIEKVKTIIAHGAAPVEPEPIRFDELLTKVKAETVTELELTNTIAALEATKQIKRVGRDHDQFIIGETKA